MMANKKQTPYDVDIARGDMYVTAVSEIAVTESADGSLPILDTCDRGSGLPIGTIVLIVRPSTGIAAPARGRTHLAICDGTAIHLEDADVEYGWVKLLRRR